MDTEKSTELWDQLANEPRRAFEAFQTFLSLPSDNRTIIEAYRAHVRNPETVKPSDTWARWSNDYAWRERATAYDDHLTRLRREAYERAIEEEAGRQAREVEKARGRANELLTLSYERAMEWLENAQPSDLRFQDVVSIIRLHMDYLKAFPVQPEPSHEDEWTEEDDAEAERIAKEIIAKRDLEEGAQGSEEEDSESDGSDEDKEDSENPEDDPDQW